LILIEREMGLCASEAVPAGVDKEKLEKQRKFNAQMDNKMQSKQMDDSQIRKLLLLGAGESGKSTLFKQVISLYGKGFTEDDRKALRNVVHNNTVLAMKTLVKYSDLLKHPVAPENEASKQAIQEMKTEAPVDAEVAAHIERLWADAGIKQTYAERAKFQLIDSSEYFFGRLADMSKPGYVPNEQDMLRSRVRTTGMVETHFEIDGTKFRMFDVGGQRNERKKWIHCFDAVTAVMFVAAISEYDQTLFEDDQTNRIDEALSLFEEICNSKWFRDTSMILFLNKRDIFEKKIKVVPISNHFPEYKDGADAEKGAEFFTSLFLSKNKVPQKQIYPQVTCATDKNNIQHVFNSVKDTIIRESLKGGGLM
jgi:guanine nucleotide-binding protein G(i) subunit alpha